MGRIGRKWESEDRNAPQKWERSNFFFFNIFLKKPFKKY